MAYSFPKLSSFPLLSLTYFLFSEIFSFLHTPFFSSLHLSSCNALSSFYLYVTHLPLLFFIAIFFSTFLRFFSFPASSVLHIHIYSHHMAFRTLFTLFHPYKIFLPSFASLHTLISYFPILPNFALSPFSWLSFPFFSLFLILTVPNIVFFFASLLNVPLSLLFTVCLLYALVVSFYFTVLYLLYPHNIFFLLYHPLSSFSLFFSLHSFLHYCSLLFRFSTNRSFYIILYYIL